MVNVQWSMVNGLKRIQVALGFVEPLFLQVFFGDEEIDHSAVVEDEVPSVVLIDLQQRDGVGHVFPHLVDIRLSEQSCAVLILFAG